MTDPSLHPNWRFIEPAPPDYPWLLHHRKEGKFFCGYASWEFDELICLACHARAPQQVQDMALFCRINRNWIK